QVGIADPNQRDRVLAWLQIEGGAVVTSGSYEKFFEHEGKRYAHIIDPRSGYPVTEVKSVTLVCPDAELADALATAVFVLGPQEGLALVNRLKDIECLIVDAENKITYSKNIQLQYYQNEKISKPKN
ncbi:MAG: FAD:protein FMN transferase, partial [Bacteroidia bacterium]|nr:FAD:protein FMN transferase [Bacteroidia bacterium]